jgi:glycosyltransferase involved in cell wall biosynthesis
MKVLILSNVLPPAGGAEKVAWEVAKVCSTHYETHILCFGNKRNSEIIDNVHVHYLPERGHTFRYYLTKGRKEILDIFQKIKPDVIHAHGNTVFAHVLRKLKNVNKIITYHHSYMHCYKWKKTRRFKFMYLFNGSYKNYDHVTTTSLHMQKYFSDRTGREIHLIGNGYRDTEFKTLPNYIRNPKSIFYVGQMTIAKGVDILLKLAKMIPEYQFTFVGKGLLKDSVKLDNVLFAGVVSSEELLTFFNTHEYSVFPSQYENFPLVGLEAMACGSIVIASNRGFIEYLENERNGFLINDIDEYKISKIILQENNLSTIRNYALKTVKKYTWQHIFSNYQELYKK